MARDRTRRRLPIALVGTGVAILGTGVALASGLELEPELKAVESSGLVAYAAGLEEAERVRARRELNSRFVLGVKRSTLESIADCESGGDPAARSSDGSYRGKYQFDRGTWEAMGGNGDPAKAPEIEQDYRAAELYKVAGSSPWPACG